MTQIYKVGTATVTNGSTTVAGTDTGWAVAGVVGGLFTRNGLSVPIDSVTDDDTLVLALPWPGPSSTGAYTIARENSAAASVVSLYQKMSEATVTMMLSAIPPKGIGSLTQRDELDLAPEDTDFIFLHMDEVGPDLFLEFYRWGGFDWIGPFPAVIPGTPGPAGGDGPAGEGFNPRGEWNNIDTYDQNDFVWRGPRNFVSIVDGNTNHTPPNADEDDSYWQFVPTAQGAPGADGTDGTNGTNGTDGADGEDGREVQIQVGATHIQWRYQGDVSWTDLIALADLKGDTGGAGSDGSNGADGADGNDGWSPVLVLVSDGNRRVFQVDDWVGGEGTKPATGDYVGDTALVPDIGDAVDVRGPAGAGAGDVNTSGSVTSQRLARYADATGDVIEDAGYTVAGVLDRANHTGTQAQSTITDLPTDLAAKAPLASPALTGNPTAPTQTAGNNSTRLATTAFVTAAIAALIDGAPGAIDTLNELAAALGDDPNFATTVNAAIAARLVAASNLSDLANAATARTNLGMSANGSALVVAANYAAMRALLDLEAGTDFYSISAPNAAFAAASHTHTVSALSDASANARSFLQAANYAAMKTLLSLVKADVGLGNVDNTSNATERAASATLSNKTLTDPAIDGCVKEEVFTITDAAGFQIDPSNGAIQFVTLGANRTPAATNFQDGESVTLRIADGSAFAITWTTVAVVWKGGAAPTLATSGYTEVNLEKSGGVIRGVHIGDFAS